MGRHGYQKYGLCVSGSADQFSHRIANILVCNSQDSAVLEITLFGLKLKALQPSVIAITGGDLNPEINGERVPMWASMKVKEGDIIHFRANRSGCRAYLAIAGGIDLPPVLNSRSTDIVGKIGGFDGRSLRKGDIVNVGRLRYSFSKLLGRRLDPTFIPDHPNNVDIKVILGPQDEYFTNDGIKTLLSSSYIVTKDSDRMGCRLDGPKIKHKHGADILTEGNFFGAIQVPKTGLPIVFLVGRPSIGGYTKVGGVITVDLPKLSQVKPGDTVNFRETTMAEAHQSLKKQEKLFRVLRINC